MLKNNMISADYKFFDLKSGHDIPYSYPFYRKEMDNEQGKNNIRAADGISSWIRVPEMRGEICRGIQGKVVLLPGAVLCHGICANSISREPEGYGDMPGGGRTKAVSHGYKKQAESEQPVACEQDEGLADICGGCTGSHQAREETLRGRAGIGGAASGHICAGFDNYRSLPEPLQMGEVPQEKRCDKTSHTDGNQELHADRNLCYGWKNPRRKLSGPAGIGARGNIYHGQRLCGLQEALRILPELFVLCDTCKKKPEMPCRAKKEIIQERWDNLGSGNSPQRLLSEKKLSSRTEADKMLRYRNENEACYPHEQLPSARKDHCVSVQVQMEDRNIFQMDKAESENKDFLRHKREYSEDADMDSNLCLCHGVHNAEGTWHREKRL